MKTGGIVLCGGHSSRMGRPKAWLPFGDELMLPRIVRILCGVVDPVVVVAAPGQDVPELPREVAIIRDEIEGKGPLGGLAAGLAGLEGKADAAYLSSCDVPFLKPEFVLRILESLRQPHPLPPPPGREGESPSPPEGGVGEGFPVIAVPRVGGYFHPLAAAYRLSVLPHIRKLLVADQLRPVFLFDRVPTRIIEPHELQAVDPGFRSLQNLNTPEEYAAALRLAGHSTTEGNSP
jgi:molybdenum cofactor guanylyltransferase